MRLNRLDLTRYGKFTDCSIDFGEPVPGRPDLHIVYGPNEAGKSTALAAFLDLLFGIETRSRFNFLHPYPAMRIGGSLELGGAVHELVRIKRAQNSLLDGTGLPIAETLLAGQLGSIDHDSYRAMFSLDDDTLEAGGESILASKGELGELLFSASAGLADLSRTLTELRAEADGFYRYHAHGTELASYKERLAELRRKREQIDTAATRYAILIDGRDRALHRYEEALAARAATRSRMDEIQRHVSALPRLADLRAMRAALEPLADLSDAPAGWAEALPGLRDEEVTLTVHEETTARDITDISAELDAIVVDEAALAVADRVDRLDDLRARFVTAAKDIPTRRLEMREAEQHIAGILGRIGRAAETEPHRLVLGAATVGALQDLIAKRSGVETAVETAAQELSEARHRLQEAEARLQAAGANGAEAHATRSAALSAAVAAVQASDHTARRRVAERSRTGLLDALADQTLALRPWQGDIDQLAALALPDPSDVRRWKDELAAAQNKLDQWSQDLERASAEQARLTAECQAIARVGGVTSDAEAAGIRAEREAAWATHRRTLDTASADAFETVLRRDDIVMNARLRHEADIARLHQTGEALARAEAATARAQEEFAKAAERLQQSQAMFSAAVATFLPGATLDLLESWLDRRGKALDTRAKLRQAERDLSEAAADAEGLRRRLLAALDGAGVPHDAATGIDELCGVAQGVLNREAELRGMRSAVQECRRDVQARERRLAMEAERDQKWQAAWSSACTSCWLGDCGTPPALPAVREILRAVAELEPALDQRASLLDRIEKMQDDQAAFAREVVAITQLLGCPSDDDAPLDLAERISRGVRDARTAALRRSDKLKELEKFRTRQRELAETRRVHETRAREMQEHFAVGSLAEVAAKLSAIARKAELEVQAAAAARDILDALRASAIADAERSLDSADRAALDGELAELEARFTDQDQRTRDLFSAHSKAVDEVEAVGGDDAVARIEEQRRTVLLEIEDRAARYIRLRAGIAAAEHALRSYRQQHRSAMMDEASQAFRTISCGAYTGLASQPSKESELLVALAADGGSKVASELSRGTRFQLYLALRVAGYREFARLRPPVPFIADDIMETFDDERAEQALRLLAKIGEVGQAIYLTHHRHLCEIALRICPGVRLHELSTGRMIADLTA
jgi:uncharacterized protein YhaN